MVRADLLSPVRADFSSSRWCRSDGRRTDSRGFPFAIVLLMTADDDNKVMTADDDKFKSLSDDDRR